MLHVFILCRAETDELLRRRDLLNAVAGVHCMLVPDDDTLVSANELRSAGWTHMNSSIMGKDVTAWERATYLALKSGHAHSWFIEDDVYWTRTDHLVKLLLGYGRSKADLIAQSIALHVDDDPAWPHWHEGKATFVRKDMAASFNVLCRMSRELLQAMAQIAQKNKRLCFLEVLFASTCKSAGLRYATLASERLLLRYRPRMTNEELTFYTSKTYARIFHPVRIN